MNIVKKIRAYIDATPGMNQTVFAEKAGIAGSRLSDLLRERHEWVNLHNTLNAAKVMGVSVEWLADESTDWPPPKETDDDGRKLTKDQERLLEIASELGTEIAFRRLYRLPDPADDGGSFPAQPLGSGTPGKKGR